MPFYGGGRPDSSVHVFCDGQVVLEVLSGGGALLWADDSQGNAPQLTAADCAAIGDALLEISEES